MSQLLTVEMTFKATIEVVADSDSHGLRIALDKFNSAHGISSRSYPFQIGDVLNLHIVRREYLGGE